MKKNKKNQANDVKYKNVKMHVVKFNKFNLSRSFHVTFDRKLISDGVYGMMFKNGRLSL